MEKVNSYFFIEGMTKMNFVTEIPVSPNPGKKLSAYGFPINRNNNPVTIIVKDHRDNIVSFTLHQNEWSPVRIVQLISVDGPQDAIHIMSAWAPLR